MSISGINGGSLLTQLSNSNQDGMNANQIAALLDSNQTQTDAAFSLVQSIGQSPQTQVGDQPLSQDHRQAQQGGRLDVFA